MSAYNRLNQIWSGQMVSDQVNVKRGTYTVPKICPQGEGPHYPPSYSTLHHDLDESHRHGVYFNMKGAYPFADCESCKVSMTERPCLGHIDCNGQQNGNGQQVPAVEDKAPAADVLVKEEAKEVIEGYLRSRYGRNNKRMVPRR